MRISDWSSDVCSSDLLASVIADNTSAAAFMTGEHGITPAGLDLKTLGVVILRNGEVAATAAGAAVLGSPLNSVALLANMLGKRDREIPARSEEHTSELQSLMRISYAVFCLKKKKTRNRERNNSKIAKTQMTKIKQDQT